MTTVITGATGHLGRLVVESLLERGVAPSALVAGGRRIERIADLAGRGVVTVTIDYADPSSISGALAGADTVLLVSGSEIGSRVAQHSAVITAAVEAGVRHIVYTSAPHADDTALAVAPEHAATERIIRDSGIPFTFLRNGWYTENYLGTIDEARATGEITASLANGRVASASRRDFADAAAVVLTGPGHENRVYELTGDVAWDFDDLAAAIADIIGSPVTYRRLAPDTHLQALVAAGLDEGTAGFLVALDGNIRDGLLGETSGELSRLIGRPTTPLREGLAAAVSLEAAPAE